MKSINKWVYELKVFPVKTVTCSKCHRLISAEPFLIRTHFRGCFSYEKEVICWHCVRSREGCHLVVKAFPNIYIAERHGQFYQLEYRKKLRTLFDGG